MSGIKLVDGDTYELGEVLGDVELDSSYCSHWLLQTRGQEGRVTYEKYACYAPFAGLAREKKSLLYIGIRKVNPTDYVDQGTMDLLNTEAGYKRWLEWIVERSPHSPAVVQGQEWGYNMFVEMNVDADGHLVHHTACVLRIHQEHTKVPLYWMLYTNAGMEEDLAYLMALQTCITEDGNSIGPSHLVSHAALSSIAISNLAGFLLRRYNKQRCPLPSWKDNSKYSGHGSMWDCGRSMTKNFDIRKVFPEVGGRTVSIFSPPPHITFPLTHEGVNEFVEVVSEKVPALLGVKLINNPDTTGVKYEKA